MLLSVAEVRVSGMDLLLTQNSTIDFPMENTTPSSYVVSHINSEYKPAAALLEPSNHTESIGESSAHPTAGLYEFYFIVNGIIGCTVCIIGLVGNVTSVTVLSTMYKRNRTSTNIFLIAMSSSDLIVLTIYLVYGITCLVLPDRPILESTDITHYTGTFTCFIYYIWYFPANIFMTTSNWNIVAVMSFRFIAVHFPLQAAVWCSATKAKLVVISVVTLSILLVLPEFLTVKIVTSEEQGFTFDDTHLFDSKSFNHVYYTVAEVFNSLLPFLVCTALAALLLRALRKKDQRLSQQSNKSVPQRRQFEQRRISIMLLGITVWFIICTCPSFICRIAKYLMTSDTTARQSWTMFRGVSDMFLLLNHTANFILYAVTNHSYQQHFLDLVLCRDRKALDRQTSVAQSLTRPSNKSAAANPSMPYRYTSIRDAVQ